MKFYELEMDEDGVKSLVKNIIDSYEEGLHNLGSYAAAVSNTQEVTIASFEDVAGFTAEQVSATRH